MVQLAGLFLSLVALSTSVYAAPLTLERRIQQTIADSLTEWEQACNTAGGGKDQCSALKVSSFQTLLAGGDDCGQQDAADNLMNRSKQLNSQEMITLTQIFVQQPRNTPGSVATSYCQKAPQNAELNGLFQCQFQGADQNNFSNGSKLGGTGTIPFGLSAPLNPLGSCPANPSGPIADGTQLADLTTNPGNVGGGTAQAQTTASVTVSAAPQATASTVAEATPNPVAAVTNTASGGFQLQNGLDAQALNKKFATLTATSSCTAGETACVNGSVAQCVGGQFVLTSCGPSSSCFVLPLVNSPGTSVTCDTQADALARFAASGATGGLTGA